MNKPCFKHQECTENFPEINLGVSGSRGNLGYRGYKGQKKMLIGETGKNIEKRIYVNRYTTLSFELKVSL